MAALMTREEAAEYLSLSVWTLWRLRSEGKLPFVKIGNQIRFRQRDLDEFVERNVQGGNHS